MRRYPIAVLLLPLVLTACAERLSRYPGPVAAGDAVAHFEVRDGFRIDLYAAEPHVADPVEMTIDEHGRMYVVEMPDYPDKPAVGQGRSRILRLHDADGDGTVDSHTVFADGLSEATSAMPWDGGLIVTAAPDILYLTDTDGDERADTRETLFTGFFENNSEAQITNLRLNPDGWIYAANFGQAGSITSPRTPDAPPVNVQGGDFRFRMDDNRFEVAAGPTQFGQAVDVFGNRFATHNTQHISHLVIPWRYLHRHPYLLQSSAILNVSDHDLRMYQRTPAPYWRATRTERRQRQYDEAGTGRVEYAADHFTGSSGGTVYDGHLFPERYRGTVFTGDVAGNLIHRDSLAPRPGSPTFVAHRAFDEGDREFLASLDPWFRPANFYVGPEGALYVLDMYRQHIETPLSIPEDLKEDMDFYAGDDRGRIYRILPESGAASTDTPSLADADVPGLVDALAHPNGWHRRTAQRLLLERRDPAAVPALRQTLASDAAPARLMALYLLDAHGALQRADYQRALDDAEPWIRVHALRLAERDPEAATRILAAIDDPSPFVALQAALSAGYQSGRTAREAFARLLDRYAGDRWMRLAVLSAPAGATLAMLETLDDRGFFRQPDDGRTAFLHDTAAAIAARGDSVEVNRFVDFTVDHPQPVWVEAGFTGLREGMPGGGSLPLSDRSLTNLQAFIRSSSEVVQRVAGELLSAVTSP